MSFFFIGETETREWEINNVAEKVTFYKKIQIFKKRFGQVFHINY